MSRGRPTKTSRIDIRVTPDERGAMIATAKALGLTLSDFAVACILEEVERVKKDRPRPANLGAGLGKSQGY